LNKET